MVRNVQRISIEELENLDSQDNGKQKAGTRSQSASRDHDTVALPDGGWGWMCVFGCGLGHFLLAGLARSFGVIYVILQERFASSAAATAWIGALYNVVRFGGGPVAAALVNRFKFRRVVISGGVLICGGLVTSAYAPNITFLFFSYGALLGFGASLVWTPGYIIVGQYFDKKKGKAMGFATVGSGLGGMCIPWIVKLLYDSYAYYGTMLVTGAVMLNCCVIGALYRPFAPPRRKRVNHGDQQRDEPPKLFSLDSDDSDIELSNETNLHPLPEKEKQRVTAGLANGTIQGDREEPMIKAEKNKTMKPNKKTIFDFSLLLNRTFFVYGIVVMSLSITQQTYNIFIVAIGKERGLDDTRSIILTAISGSTDMAGRILSGFLFDLKFVRKYRRFIICGALFMGASCEICIPFTSEYVGLVVLSALFGLFMGSGHAQRVTVLGDLVEKSRVPNAVGFLIWFQGIGQLFGPALAGFLKDYFGDYAPTFYFGGSSLLLSILLFCVEAMLPKRCCKLPPKGTVRIKETL